MVRQGLIESNPRWDMTKFTDEHGDEWDLTLSVGVLEDIKEGTSHDFDTLLREPERLAELLTTSPQVLGSILWCILQEQAESRGLDPRAFGRRLTRPVIDKAVDSLIEAILLFYPRGSAGRTLVEQLPALLGKMDKVLEAKAKLIVSEGLSNMPTV